MIAEVVDVLQFVGMWAGSLGVFFGGVGGAMKISEFRYQKKITKRRDADIAARTTDGRLDEEWYELVKGMGKEEYEKISRGALDGLEESKVHKWDAEKLMGKVYFDKLMREWYPERYEVKKPVETKPVINKELDYYQRKYNVYNESRVYFHNAIATSTGTPKAIVGSDGLSIYSSHPDPIKQAKKRVTLASLEDMYKLQSLMGVPVDTLLGRRTQDTLMRHTFDTRVIDKYGVYFVSIQRHNFVLVINILEPFNANGCKKYYVKKVDSGIGMLPDYSAKQSLAKMAVETYKMLH